MLNAGLSPRTPCPKIFGKFLFLLSKDTIRHEKLGADRQTSVKVLSTPAEVKAHLEKPVAGKMKKGYHEAKVKAVKKVAKKGEDSSLFQYTGKSLKAGRELVLRR